MWPETTEIVEALKTLNNPVINTVIESYEFALEDQEAAVATLSDFGDDLEAQKSLQSTINHRTAQIITFVPLLRKLYRFYYQEKQSMI